MKKNFHPPILPRFLLRLLTELVSVENKSVNSFLTLEFFVKYLFCLFLCVSSVFAEETVRPVRIYVDIVGDLFHAGHVAFLKKAKSFGDYLIVGVLADDTVEEYKREPIITLEDRVKVVEACRYVDQVVVAPPLRLTEEMIRDLEIDYVVHGDDFNPALLEDQYGVSLKLGIFKTVPYTPGISTTQIIERIVNRYDCGEFRKKK